MKVIYEGTDITSSVAVCSCVHDMYAEQRSDTLMLRFNDAQGLWTHWNPQRGECVQVTEGDENTGKMFVSRVSSENGIFVIRAMSMPLSGEVAKSRSWEEVRFLQIGADIANAHGLQFDAYSVTDRNYAYLKQERQTDFEFFNRLCLLEGCAMLIYNGRLVVYDEQAIENKPPTGGITVGADGVFDYVDDSALAYGSAEITSGQYRGVFKAPNGNTGRVLRPRVTPHCTSDAEATRYARGLLRAANKATQTGTLRKPLLRGYSAGSLAALTTSKASAWNGIVFITHVRHNLLTGESKLFFRKRLEGY